MTDDGWTLSHRIENGEHLLAMTRNHALVGEDCAYIVIAVKISDLRPRPTPGARLWINEVGPVREMKL